MSEPRPDDFSPRDAGPVHLLTGLRVAGQAVSSAANAEQVGRALMRFSATLDVDVARLLLFGRQSGAGGSGELPVPAPPALSQDGQGRFSFIEMRESWTSDERPVQPCGTRLPLDTYPLAGLMRPDEPIVVSDVVTDPRASDAVRLLMAGLGVRSFLVVPLRVQDRWLGALFLGRSAASTYSDELIAAAWTLAGQAAGALDAQKRDQTEQALRQLATEVARAASSMLDPDELIQQAVHLIRDRFGLYYVGLFLVEAAPGRGAWAVLRAGTGEAAEKMVTGGHRLAVGGQSMIGWCIANRRPRIASNVGREAIRFDNPLLPDTRSELALPLLTRGEAIGALTVQSTEEAAFQEEIISVLQTLADQLATAIVNARLFRDRERRLTEMAVVNEVGRALSSPMEQDELLEMVRRQVSRLFDTSTFYIALYEEGSDEWLSALHMERGESQPPHWYSLAAGLTGHMLRTRQTLVFGTQEEYLAFLDRIGQASLGEAPRSWLAVPLIAANDCVGVMCIQSYATDNLYGERDLALFTTVAGQVAVAIANLRLLAAARRRARELEAINEVGRAITSVLDVDSLLHRMADITKQYFGGYFVSLLLVDASGKHLVYRAGSTIGASELRLEQGRVIIDLDEGSGLTGRAVRTRQPVVVHDVRHDPGYVPLPELDATRSELDVPIEVQGNAIGVLNLQSDRPHAFDRSTASVLRALADQAGVAIENARLFEETTQRTTALQVLYNINLRLSERLEAPELLRAVVEQAIALLNCETGGIYVYEPQTNELALTVAVGYLDKNVGTRLKPGEGLSGEAFSQRKSRIIEDYQAWPQHATAYGREARLHGLMAVPLIGHSGVLGVLDIASGPDRSAFGERDIWLAELFAAQAATALDNAQLFEQTEMAAQETERLYQAGRAMAGARDVDAVMRAVLQYARPLEIDRCMVVLLDDVEAPPVERRVRVQAAWDRAGHEDRVLGTSFGPDLIPFIMTFGPADRLQVQDFDTATVDERVRATFRALGVTGGAVVPLAVGQRMLGWLLAETIGRPCRLRETELDGLQSIAGQAAVALENRRLLRETRLRAQELQALNEVGRVVTSILDLHGVLQQIVDITKERFGYYFVGIALVEGSDVVFRSGSTIGGSETRLQEGWVDLILDAEHGLIAITARTGQPTLVQDVSTNPHYMVVPELEAVRAELDVPIMTKGQVIGVLTVQDDRPFRQPEQTLRLVQALADQAGAALDNARLFESTQRAEAEQRRRSEELSALYRLSMELGTEQRDLNSMLDTISLRAMAMLASDGGGVWLWREEEHELELVVDYQPGGMHLVGRRLKPGIGLTGQAFAEKKVRVIDDYLAWNGHPDTFADAPFMAGMAAPMIWQNQPIGALVVTRTQPGRPYGPGEQALAELLAAQATTFVQNARLFDQARIRAEELAILNEMGRTLSGELDIAAVTTTAHRHVARLMDATNMYIALYDSARQMITFPAYIDGETVRHVRERPVAKGLTEYVIHTREPLLLPDNVAERCRQAGLEPVGQDAECWLGVPMLVGDRVTGIIAVQSYDTPRVYDDRDRDLLVATASQVAVAIENARLFEEEERTAALLANRVRQLDCLSDIGRQVQDAPPVPEFLGWLAGRLPQAMQHAGDCVAAVELEGQVYGVAEAFSLPRQMVHRMVLTGRPAGRIVVAYRQEHDFLDEESALLGDVARRVSGYVENQGLVEETDRAARRLAEERALLRTLIDSLPDPTFVMDRDGKFTLSNLAHVQSLGAASEAELVGQTDYDRFPHEVASGLYADEQQVMRSGQPVINREESMEDGEGSRRWLSTTRVPLQDHEGRITGLVGMNRDVTDRKRAEEVVRDSESRLRAILDAIQTGVLILDPQTHTIADVNPAGARMFGAPREAIVGSLCHKFVCPADVGKCPITDLGQTVDNAERVLLTAEGKRRPIIKTVGRIMLGGRPHLLESFTDITDRKEAEARVERSRNHLHCLSDIGQKIGESLPAGEFMEWVAGRIPPAFQHPRLCSAAIEFEGKTYGAAEALRQPRQIVQALRHGQDIVGRVCVAYREDHDFSDEESALLGDVARRVDSYIENRRLLEQARTALAEVEATHRRYLQGRWEAYLSQREDLLSSGFIYDQAQEAPTPVDLWRPEMDEALRLAAPAQTAPGDAASPGSSLRQGEPAGTGDGQDRRTGLAVPIVLRGQPIGVLGIEDPQGGQEWSGDEIALLEEVGQQLALALENARLFEETQRRAERERLVTEITARIRASTDILGVLETTATELGRALNTSRAVVKLTVED